MPRKRNNSIANDSQRQLAAARDEEVELLHRKYELELEECRIRQQKEELTFRIPTPLMWILRLVRIRKIYRQISIIHQQQMLQ